MMRATSLFLLIVFSSVFLSAGARADGDAILVLDASGSMWGQIDGKAKIEIAREVIGDLLDDILKIGALALLRMGTIARAIVATSNFWPMSARPATIFAPPSDH